PRETIRRALILHLLERLTESERLGLSKDIRHEYVVMPAERIERFGECDEVARDEPGPLIEQLVERVLPVRPRLSPVDGAGLAADDGPLDRDMLAVALHRQLLQVRREPLQILAVRQDGDSFHAEKVVVPNREQGHQHWHVALEWSGPEMLIHLVEAVQHGA